MHWVNRSNFEVSGLGTIRIEPNGIIRVMSAMLLPQKNGPTHSDIEAEAVNRALFELRDAEGDLKWFWHSHVDMPVFWSGTDMTTIREFGAGGFVIASVFNKKREIRSAALVNDGMMTITPWADAKVEQLFYDQLKTTIQDATDPLIAEWDASYEKNVTNVVSKMYTGNKNEFDSDAFDKSWLGSGYSRSPNGAWVKVPAVSQDPVGTLITGTTGSEVRTIVRPPANRPQHVTKRDYKAWKKRYKAQQDAAIDVGHRVIALGVAPAPKSEADLADERDVTDVYGFDQDERLMLAQEGWTDLNIDTLFEQDFSPKDIILLVQNSVDPEDVCFMLNQGYNPMVIMHMVENNSFNDELADMEDIQEELEEDRLYAEEQLADAKAEALVVNDNERLN